MKTWEKAFLEVAPPGREPQVRKLKGKVGNPYAVAWASYNKEKEQEGGPGSGRRPYGGKLKGEKEWERTHQPQMRRTAKYMASSKFKSKMAAFNKKYAKTPGLQIHLAKQANSSGGLPQTLRGQKQSKTMCGTDWGRSRKNVEENPYHDEKGKFTHGGSTGSAFSVPMDKRTLSKMKKLASKGDKLAADMVKQYSPSGKAWGVKVPGMQQSEVALLRVLLRESVAKSTYRFSESNLMEVVAPVQAASEVAPEGPMVKCVLITEGLGNRADMHYYGPECIQAGVGLFEGQPCFVDHQKRSEQQDQPERSVRDKCGYFRNVRAERVDGKLGLVAELHYDLSETGRYAYDKACTAIHYKQEFPDSDKEYIGLSIAADGKLEEKTMMVGDEVLDVKYVTEFTAVGSVDEVTSPARGGRFVQVLSR